MNKTKRIYQKVDRHACRMEILRMAKAGEPRPMQSTVEGRYLSQATCPAVKSYWDEDFDRTLRLLRPDWFKKARKRVEGNKADIIELATNGAGKPSMKTKLGTALHHYTYPTSMCYDSEFHKTIVELRPDWFFSHTSEWKRDAVRELAKSGAAAPHNLYLFTTRSSKIYNEEFHEELAHLRPDWMLTHHEVRTNSIKQQLLEIARSGGKRPGYGNQWNLYTAFRRYTMPHIADAMFDADFFHEIYALRPEWFIRYHGNTIESRGPEYKRRMAPLKEKLLEMARSGAPAPHHTTQLNLYQALRRYTRPHIVEAKYDEEFHSELLALRPDWFASERRQAA